MEGVDSSDTNGPPKTRRSARAEARRLGAAEALASVDPGLIERARAVRGVYASAHWKYRANKTFIAVHGVERKPAFLDRIGKLAKAFTIEQAWLIAGWEFGGVFADSGLLQSVDGLPISDGEPGETERMWVLSIADAARGLPDTAPIRDELEWVAAHLHEDAPEFDGAPSVTACNMWMGAKSNDQLLRDFWGAHLRRRQPGLTGRSQESPFEEDRAVEGEDDAAARDAAAYKRLFGG